MSPQRRRGTPAPAAETAAEQPAARTTTAKSTTARPAPRKRVVPTARTDDAAAHEPEPATDPVAARGRRERLRERLRRRFH